MQGLRRAGPCLGGPEFDVFVRFPNGGVQGSGTSGPEVWERSECEGRVWGPSLCRQ